MDPRLNGSSLTSILVGAKGTAPDPPRNTYSRTGIEETLPFPFFHYLHDHTHSPTLDER